MVSKSIIFLVNHFWATFIDIWRFFSGHTFAAIHLSIILGTFSLAFYEKFLMLKIYRSLYKKNLWGGLIAERYRRPLHGPGAIPGLILCYSTKFLNGPLTVQFIV